MRKAFYLAGVVSLASFSPAMAQTNQIYNPGFETGPARPDGNLLPVAPNSGNAVGWFVGPGAAMNVVQVDGPGGYNYATNGPENDASGNATTSNKRRYLDITNGTNYVYQRFTPRCSGKVDFGAYFSTRANGQGVGSLQILTGSNPNGTAIAASNPVNLPGGNSMTDPWVLTSGSVNLTANTTYIFKARLDNNLNMDEAYVFFPDCNTRPYWPDVSPDIIGEADDLSDVFTGNAILPVDFPSSDPTPGQSACCGPWYAGKIPQMLNPVFPNGAASPYRMDYVLNPAADAEMKAWLGYVHAMDPSITSVSVRMVAADLGTSAAPASSGNSAGGTVTATWVWSGGTVTSSVTGNFGTGTPFAINQWYGFRTDITHNGTPDSAYFPADCITDAYYFRWQATAARMGSYSFGSPGQKVQQSRAIPVAAGQRVSIDQTAKAMTIERPRIRR